MSVADLTIQRADAGGIATLRDQILPVYASSHHDMMHDPWFHPDRFWERLKDLYAPTRDFELVTGWHDGRVVGYAFGSPRDGATALWNEAKHAISSLESMDETEPVYIFREFAVHPSHQRRGFGRTIHDALLANRSERIANLLVRPDNLPARSAYVAWGWQKIGTKQPFEDSPVFDSMVKVLASGVGRLW